LLIGIVKIAETEKKKLRENYAITVRELGPKCPDMEIKTKYFYSRLLI